MEHLIPFSRPARNDDEWSNIHPLTCAKRQLHLCAFQPSAGSSQVAAQFPWEQEDTGKKILQCTKQWDLKPSPTDWGWVAHTSAKAGVRSCCSFIFSYESQSGLSTPRLFTLPRSLSLALSAALKSPFAHVPPTDICSHIFFFVRKALLSCSLTQYIPVISGSKGAQARPCLCV